MLMLKNKLSQPINKKKNMLEMHDNCDKLSLVIIYTNLK